MTSSICLDYIKGSKVDIILCNPPYFKVDEHSNLNESEHYLLSPA